VSPSQSPHPAEGNYDVLSLVSAPQARFYRQQVDTLTDAGVSITTLSVPGDNIDGERVDSRSPLDYLRFFPSVLAHADDGYDLVHANFGLTGPMALAQRELPVVLSLWGTDVYGRYGWVGKLAARLADEVIVMSEEMADALPVDAHVVPHGIDLDRFAPADHREAQQAVGWDPGKTHVLFPYRPGREVKNYPLAERVVEAVDDRLDEAVVLQTVFGVPHDEVSTYMNAADALLLPSSWEGSPNSVKEALACNLPVVTTDVGDVRERLADVSPSRVCRSESELIEGLTDVLEDGRQSNGREAAAEVSIDEMGRRILDVYDAAVGDARQRSAAPPPATARADGQR
jgi:glycosyltransferase involved in cell wall biosynthesis